jgi:hypothetical protein
MKAFDAGVAAVFVESTKIASSSDSSRFADAQDQIRLESGPNALFRAVKVIQSCFRHIRNPSYVTFRDFRANGQLWF